MSLNRRSVQIMSSTGSAMNAQSPVIKADSYYGYTDGLHTIQVVYDQYVGRFRVQCTLSLEPVERDWFDVSLSSVSGNGFNELGLIQYNVNNPANYTEAYTFQGNFTFLRVLMDRSYIGDGTTYDSSYGQIARVILSA